MYVPHKQDSIKEELKLIETISFKHFVDKYEVMKLLNCSERTADRRLRKLGYTHTASYIIEMLKDFENGISTKELATKYKCSEVNINATARRHNIVRVIGHLNRIKCDFSFFETIDTEQKAYILRFYCC